MRRYSKPLFFLASAAILFLLAIGAQAATLNVPGDYPTIQAAINAANAGDTILVAAGTYPESLSWIGKDVILRGAGAGQSIIDPSQGPGGRCLYTNGLTSAAHIDGFTFQKGAVGNLDIGDWEFGGGIFNDSSSPTVANCAFQDNMASDGGAMFNQYGSVSVTHCTFTGNTGNDGGGGMYNYFNTATVTHCTFDSNADFDQGGAAMVNYGTVTLTDCVFTGNYALSNLSYTTINDGSVSVTNCTFSSNLGTPMVIYGNTSVTNCTFTGNSPQDGDFTGGIEAGGGTVTKCIFLNNTGRGEGGAMRLSGYATVTDCLFEGNASAEGGAMSVFGNYYSSSAANVTGCTFIGNTSGYGGALENFSSNATVTNCAFSGNTAYSGGAILNWSGASLTLTNCTLSGNTGGQGGAIFNGGLWSDGFTTTLRLTNSILWGNSATAYNGIAPSYGGIATVTYTDLQDLSNSTPDANGNFAADPLFVRNPGTNGAGDYGDLHLSLVSPCIDAGSDAAIAGVATDLDGNPRISRAHVDLGAYEYQNHAPMLSAPASAQVDVGCPATFQASATDLDGDTLTYSLVSPPSWASIISSTGQVTLAPPAGTAGTVILTVQATDPYGASDQKSVSVSVCPILLSGVTLSRQNKTVTVQFTVQNTDGTIVSNVSLNSATLGGVSTNTALPIVYAQLKQGVVKTVLLKFQNVPSGPATFLVSGTSSAGPVCANMTVNVP